MEHEGIVSKLHSRQFLCVKHELERFNPMTYIIEAATLPLVVEAAHTPKPVTTNAAAGATANELILRI